MIAQFTPRSGQTESSRCQKPAAIAAFISFTHKTDPLVRGLDDAPSQSHSEGMSSADIETLRAFYVGNRQQLYTYAVSITGNREAAEDAIQGVFEKLLRGGKLPTDLRPYLFRSIRNTAFDAWRRVKVRTDSVFDTAESEPSITAPMEDLDPLLQRLSPEERETIVLKICSGLSFREIAELRQVPLPTVASWYRRGLEGLKTMLTAES
jgi:RNA polymerase sigma factor (sigma-70 family)